MEKIWKFLKILFKCIGIVTLAFMSIIGFCFGVFLIATSAIIGGLAICIISIALPIAVWAFILDNC